MARSSAPPRSSWPRRRHPARPLHRRGRPPPAGPPCGRSVPTPPTPEAGARICHAGLVPPAERVRIVTETARAVLEGRLDPEMGAGTLALQQEQIGDHLRGDRIDVTRFEMEEVATTLRRLGEQISDRASGLSDP